MDLMQWTEIHCNHQSNYHHHHLHHHHNHHTGNHQQASSSSHHHLPHHLSQGGVPFNHHHNHHGIHHAPFNQNHHGGNYGNYNSPFNHHLNHLGPPGGINPMNQFNPHHHHHGNYINQFNHQEHLSSAPTIKNHSVTHFGGYLYCFGGYDGRRNHMTLLIYSIAEQRWIRPFVMNTSTSTNNSNSNNNNNNNMVGTTGGGRGGSPMSQGNGGDFFPMHPNNHGGGPAVPASNNNNNNNMDHPHPAINVPPHHHQQQQQPHPQQQPFLFPHYPNNNNMPLYMQHGMDEGDGGGDNLLDAPYGGNDPAREGLGNNNNNNNNHNTHANHPSGPFSFPSPIWVTGTPPPGRNGHSATLVIDDDDDGEDENHPESGRIIVLGGWLGTGPLAASDMHVLDISRGGRQLRWYQPSVKGTPPGPCNMHSADYVKQQKTVYVFRGGNGREYLNDLHALDVITMEWRRVETTGEIPQQRANHSSAILDEELFIFGGWNGTERLNDIHILDTRNKVWTCPHVGGVLPHPRAGMTLTALRGRLYLFGGSGTSAKCFQDLQILDREQMAWLDVSTEDQEGGVMTSGGASAVVPPPPSNHRFEEDGPGHHRYGNGAAHYAGLVPQQYDDSGQQPLYPGGPFGGDLLNDDHQGRSLSYGASNANGGAVARNDLWRVRQQHANQVINPNDEDSVPSVLVQGRGPGRRAGHTATAVNRKIYVFGGSCGSDYLNDFFVLDTDPPPQAVVTESNSLELMERRLRHFFNDEEFSDVVFLVQGQRVYGHKMVLSIVSDCFRAMFSREAGFREAAEQEIVIPDCSHAAFLAVMEYIYTGSLPKSIGLDNLYDEQAAALSSARSSSSVSDSSSSGNGNGNGNNGALVSTMDPAQLSRLVELLELADRFFLDHLKQVCETLLQGAVHADTVEYLTAVAQKTNSGQLHEICKHFSRNREG